MQKINLFTLLALCAASGLAQAQTTTPGYIINTPEQASEIPSAQPIPAQPPALGKNVPAYPYGAYTPGLKKPNNSQNIVVAREKPLNMNLTKVDSQKKVGEAIANLLALGKHCAMPEIQKDRINKMKLSFEGSVSQPILMDYIKNSLENSFTLSTDKKNRGVAACEPNSYFVDNMAELSTDLNRALSFKNHCSSVYTSPKITEFLDMTSPLDKFVDYSIVAEDTSAISKNLLAYCNPKTENDFYIKAFRAFQDLNTKLFNNPGN